MKALVKAGLLLFMMLGFAGFSCSQSAPLSDEKKSLELTVCPQGSPQCDFSTIQEAIDAAPEGATIRIREGLYRERLTVSKSLRFIGAGQIVRISPSPQEPPASRPALVIEATDEPIQVWVEGLQIGERDAVPPDVKHAHWGIYIAGLAQVILKRSTVLGYGFGVFVTTNEQKPSLSLLQPHVIIHETTISHNSISGLATGLYTQVHIYRATITENDTGIVGSGFLLVEQSTVTKNQRAGIRASFWGSPSFGQEKIEIRKSLIAENGVGIWLTAGHPSESGPSEPKPGYLPPLAIIQENRILGNREYGIAFQTARCVEVDERWQPESLPIHIEGYGNEIRDNPKGDLCPPDSSWPLRFSK
ncbi:MAG: right-handed parallel beta-helix repeat-containing protein [Candidatus Bipolaricaulota bacterium]|nr:right-handed parallel beta-helix repeat-containing protein [Candidatus Bipolaricaulota bacterium]